MLIVSVKRPAYSIVPLSILLFLVWALYHNDVDTSQYRGDLISSIFRRPSSRTHNVVFSASTADHKFFMVDFGDQLAINPNIIPHPVLEDTWIVVAQLLPEGKGNQFAELACNAKFDNGTLRCVNHAVALPIASTFGDKCAGDLELLNLNRGPHDARVFYGPRTPYTIYGSNSAFTCFGQWIQDFRTLVEWGYEIFDENDFFHATELQRPPPWGTMEKNWFLFFDQNDQAYLHYDVAPGRVFAKVETNGAVGPDLAPITAAHDEECMARYMPKIGPQLESIHQATNSLLVTLCKRHGPLCIPDDSNTFIFTVFQHKTYFNFHALYEPYIMLFEHTAPFKIHGISRKPFWIHGRGDGIREVDIAHPHSVRRSVGKESDAGGDEMFYVTSVSWKNKGQKYHGYIDDVLFVAFGIEDRQPAAIDVVAGDLLRSLGTC
ncbi:hypothetical protein LTR24_005952 [Lithohypha guttulata]|uniref:Uncharacterized protein n=1 Tax=Lithohypha guttulata TaxID=1690604 RepID=A0ABR0K957_9EURO|nr:hypothetical protein LTR24_005952 [Lithohypha guttulata]